jgi:acyl dehydratase
MPAVTPIRSLDELVPGQVQELGGFTLSEAEIVEFAARFDPQPFHTDPATPGHPVLGGHSASGWHTAALTMRLNVEALPLAWGVVGGGVEQLAWLRPVRPGDALRLEAEVLEVGRSRSKPGQGWARFRLTTLNQRGEPVQEMTTRLIVPLRDPDAAPS